jgi:23S rRNA (uracil1939-C5)-methyltransferase
VNAAFARRKDGTILSGVYREGSHEVVNIDSCLIEHPIADQIIVDIRKLLKDFKVQIYDEDKGTGLLRHAMVRVGRKTGQVMLILVVADPVFPSKNNFVKAIRKLHPEISTVVLNVNDKDTSMVLGTRDIPIYGKGYIQDVLCGITYKLSPQSFFQVNPEMTENIYEAAIRFADLKKNQRVIDAYCGIGTIGLTAAGRVKEVIGVELNRDAVRDAIANARKNNIKNAVFYQGDAGAFMVELAEKGEKCDVLFMDPPRSGSTKEFIQAAHALAPKRIVYISCNPETLARDLKLLTKNQYQVQKITGFDQFPWTRNHMECVCLLTRSYRYE